MTASAPFFLLRKVNRNLSNTLSTRFCAALPCKRGAKEKVSCLWQGSIRAPWSRRGSCDFFGFIAPISCRRLTRRQTQGLPPRCHWWRQMCRGALPHSVRDVRSAPSSQPSSSPSESSVIITSAAILDVTCSRRYLPSRLAIPSWGTVSAAPEHRRLAPPRANGLGAGGFWHNGLVSSVGNAVFNKNDGVQIIVDNGYSAATGGQDLMSSEADNRQRATRNTIERAVKGVGVRWIRTISSTYDVARMRDTLKEALLTATSGPKVIVARSECMLNRQRRERPLLQKRIKAGLRTVQERFGVDYDTCTGDHSCIRLSGCPSLTIAPNPDPLRREPVTKVIQSCVGCGLCGEVAHAAALCPSFYRVSIVSNPSRWERARTFLRQAVISALQRRLGRTHEAGVQA